MNDNSYLLVEIDYKKIISDGYMPKMVDINTPIKESLTADVTEQDWLISKIGNYIAYLLTDEGRANTENKLTIMYYNDLMNMWKNTIEKTCNMSVTIDERPFNSIFGDISNVLSHLRDLLSIRGFDMSVVPNGYDSHFKISIKEKNIVKKYNIK